MWCVLFLIIFFVFCLFLYLASATKLFRDTTVENVEKTIASFFKNARDRYGGRSQHRSDALQQPAKRLKVIETLSGSDSEWIVTIITNTILIL